MTPEEFQQQIRDPAGIWYGPHQCNACWGIIVKKAHEQGGLALDAGDFNHQYPNFPWQEHQCFRTAQSSGGEARAAVLTPERRKQIASKAARTRWEKTQRHEP